MTTSAGDTMAPHCRLATQMPEYADEHDRCPGNAEVRLPGNHPEYRTPVLTYRCACRCHRQAPQTEPPPAPSSAAC